MLTIESLTAAKDLVAILADKGVSLTVAAGSPVAEAMAATKTSGYNIDCLGDIDKLPAELYGLNELRMTTALDAAGDQVRVPEDNLHSAYLEATCARNGVVLAGNVAHATTVVLPAISELHNKIKEALDFEATCGIRSYKVEMVTGSALLDVAEIYSKIEEFGKLDMSRELDLVLDYPTQSDEALVALMKIGSQAYDDSVDQFVAQNGIGTIREVWDVVFAGNRGSFKTYDQFRADRVKGQARNFATFLLASRLVAGGKDLPVGTGLSGLSTARYGMALRSLQEVSGAALNVALMFQRNNEKQGKLIDKIDGKTVYVNKTVYDRFMADGGDIETILGAAISGEKKVLVPEIVENVEKYKQAWSYHVTIAKQNAATSSLIDVRRVISTFVRNYVATCDDVQIKQCADGIVDFCNDWLQGLYAPALKSVDMLALRAVCEILFSHTEAKQILGGVQEAMESNPEISREGALDLSVYAYVSAWIATQIEIA